MTDIMLETARTFVMAMILVLAASAGSKHRLWAEPGWSAMFYGFALLTFGSAIDVSDNFPGLERYVVVGDSPVQAVLEKLVGYLGGTLLLFVGLIRWLPQVIAQRADLLRTETAQADLVADLTTRTTELKVAHAALRREIVERRRFEDMLRTVAEGVSADAGDAFFPSLVRHLALALKADLAFVGMIDEVTGDTIQTVATFGDGRTVANFSYALRHSPCETVVGRRTCCYERDVDTLFPNDQMLRTRGIKGYVGTPLFDARGKGLGLIVVLFKTPLDRPESVISLVEIFAARSAAELERKGAERTLDRSERNLQAILDNMMDIYYRTDREGVLTFLSRSIETVLGFRPQDLIGRNALELYVDAHRHAAFLDEMRHNGGRVRGFELRARTKAGEPVWLAANAQWVRDDDGTIQGIEGTARDISDLVAAREKLEHLAHNDPLTDMPNRRQFIVTLPQALARVRRGQQRGALLFVDLNDFKHVNDLYGHSVGDQVLVACANRLRRAVRESDMTYRIGGDEFTVVIESAESPGAAETVAEKIIASLATPVDVQGVDITVGCSIGVAYFDGRVNDCDLLIRTADNAMYRAKRTPDTSVVIVSLPERVPVSPTPGLGGVDGTAPDLMTAQSE
ncbi:MAG: diguanylate cyclase [Rhodobacterales bacterium]|nr:diguanylate cyclase [Rhodobacterales bacterium]